MLLARCMERPQRRILSWRIMDLSGTFLCIYWFSLIENCSLVANLNPYCLKIQHRNLKPGINQDGYWTGGNHVLKQTEDMMDCTKIMFPQFDKIFLFDQSSGHCQKQLTFVESGIFPFIKFNIMHVLLSLFISCKPPWPYACRLWSFWKLKMLGVP